MIDTADPDRLYSTDVLLNKLDRMGTETVHRFIDALDVPARRLDILFLTMRTIDVQTSMLEAMLEMTGQTAGSAKKLEASLDRLRALSKELQVRMAGGDIDRIIDILAPDPEKRDD